MIEVTDARFPERWLNDRRVLRLSDSAFRLFVIANVWAVSNRTDGELHEDDLGLIPSVDTAYADELAKVGLWEKIADRWLIADFCNVQTSKHDLEVLENARRRDREKKARQRARPDGIRTESAGTKQVTGTVHRERPPGQSPGTTQERTGQARTGVGEDHPHAHENYVKVCDLCTATPTVIDNSGARYCRGCAPHLWREPA